MKRAIAAAACLSAAGALASYLAAGKTLGFLFGGIVFATLIAPPFVILKFNRAWSLRIAGAIGAPIAICWLLAIREIGGGVHWLDAVLILLSYTVALGAIARSLVIIRLAPIFAQAIVIVLALFWLSWPMWLRVGNERLIASLVVAYPLMNLNSLMLSQGVWTQQHIMYRLTALGQDVPYQLPRNVWPCVAAHAVIGLLLLLRARNGAKNGATVSSLVDSPAATSASAPGRSPAAPGR